MHEIADRQPDRSFGMREGRPALRRADTLCPFRQSPLRVFDARQEDRVDAGQSLALFVGGGKRART